MINRFFGWLVHQTERMGEGIDFLIKGTKEFWGLANLSNQQKSLMLATVAAAVALTALWPPAIWLLALAPVAFVQNMFFTLVSRSRNSQDPDYHRYCAWGSNGVWFICQVMIVKNIWGAIAAGQWWYAIAAGVVYALATTEGSVLMMKRLIANESGKRRVGANDKLDAFEKRLEALEGGWKSGLELSDYRPVDAIGKDTVEAEDAWKLTGPQHGLKPKN